MLPLGGASRLALSDGTTVSLLEGDLPPVSLLEVVTRARQRAQPSPGQAGSQQLRGSLAWASQLQDAAGSEQLAAPIQLDRWAWLCSAKCVLRLIEPCGSRDL